MSSVKLIGFIIISGVKKRTLVFSERVLQNAQLWMVYLSLCMCDGVSDEPTVWEL